MAALQPSVVEHPPGADAPPRPSKAQKRVVQAVVAQHRRELANLTADEIAALAPALTVAQSELRDALLEWVARAPDGSLRFTAQSYRSSLAVVDEIARYCG